MRNRIVILCFGAALSLAACKGKTTVTNAPASVPATTVATWYDASNALDQLTKSADAGLKVTAALHSAGLLKDGPQYAGILQAFGKIFQTSQVAKNALGQIPAQGFPVAASGLSSYVTDMQKALTQLNASGVTGIKNPNSQQNAATVIADIGTSISVLAAIVKGGA